MLESKELMKLNVKLLKIGKKLAEEAMNVPDEVTQALALGANDIRNTIIESMMRGTKTGRVYDWEGTEKDDEQMIGMMLAPGGWMFPIKKRWRPHRASAPGESPAVDKGELVSKIMFDTGDMEVEIGAEAGAPYSKWLEEGTQYMDARPWLAPAVKKHEDEIVDSVGNIVVEIIGSAFEGYEK